MSVLLSLKAQAKKLKQHTLTVYFAARDPRTPVLVRLLAVLIAAYALSPIDLIPDFIPIIGYLDDLLLIPLGLALVVRLTPPAVLESARLQAEQAAKRPVSYAAAAVIVGLWLVLLWFVAQWVFSVLLDQESNSAHHHLLFTASPGPCYAAAIQRSAGKCF